MIHNCDFVGREELSKCQRPKLPAERSCSKRKKSKRRNNLVGETVFTSLSEVWKTEHLDSLKERKKECWK